MKNFRSDKTGKRGLKTLIYALVGVLVVVGLFGFVYKKGYDAGQKSAKSGNIQDLLKNNPNPFKVVSGTITKVDGDTLIVKTIKDGDKKVKLTDETKVTKKTEKLNKDALQPGVKVSVFTSGQGENLSATRVVIKG